MNIRAKVRFGARTVAVAVAGLAVASGSGMVSPAAAVCGSGFHCVYHTTLASSAFSTAVSVPDFAGHTFSGGNGDGAGEPVDNNIGSVRNSSGNLESHYYDLPNYRVFLFCVHPGGIVLSVPSNVGYQISSLMLRPRTSVACLG